MAIDLALDSVNHDLTLVNFDLQLVSDLEQVVQKLRCRLQFFSGEWFLDNTQGVDLYGTVFVKNPDLGLISTLLKSTILDTTGVNSITGYSQTYDARGRKLTVTFQADTIYGPTGPVVTSI